MYKRQQQTGKPQQVYDDPCNLFVARFLGTPQINVFKGFSKDGGIYLNDQKILSAKNLPDQELYIGIRPEGFILREDGPLSCQLSGIEVMGRDISVVSTHPADVYKRQSILRLLLWIISALRFRTDS